MNQLDRRLRQLGHHTYAEYLRSPGWQQTRARLLNARARKCWCCDAVGREVAMEQYAAWLQRGEEEAGDA